MMSVAQQPDPRNLARVLDHRIGRTHVETHDLLEPVCESAVELAYIAGAHSSYFFDQGHVESN